MRLSPPLSLQSLTTRLTQISTTIVARVRVNHLNLRTHDIDALLIVYFILRDYRQAQEDYEKSTTLDDSFVFSHIQLAVAQYKNEALANSMATFRRTMKAFPNRSEPQNY